MASLASERNWLFNPSTMKKVQQCRRLIQMEFGVKVHLNEESLVEQLESYAGKSRSDTLNRTWTELKEAVPELADALTRSEPVTKRTYRGQPIADAEPAMKSAQDEREESHPRKTKVIYRGRVVG
ncbi:hypothetical protein [Marinobacter zhanjiangensis]|uniref:Uncharacterized protein n=1 Tax=Marinobacter zhanjiangensis TaxID=578215 RepID=A0ABQ3BC59_9GAMM|nr:hypothetical protein [Marinobacter zhanjiangensis]GGY83852.1 hypothetical protein GCM10007071_33960 [Marinobacter zhanjiangensis]